MHLIRRLHYQKDGSGIHSILRRSSSDECLAHHSHTFPQMHTVQIRRVCEASQLRGDGENRQQQDKRPPAAANIHSPNASNASTWRTLLQLAGKQERLCALIALTEPDIITLQEIWDFQYLESINSLPYHCTTAGDFHGGGMATLIHRRHTTRAKMHVERHDHWLGVSVKVRDKRLVRGREHPHYPIHGQ